MLVYDWVAFTVCYVENGGVCVLESCKVLCAMEIRSRLQVFSDLSMYLLYCGNCWLIEDSLYTILCSSHVWQSWVEIEHSSGVFHHVTAFEAL